MMTPRECPFCHKLFDPKQQNQIICKSPECETAWHRKYYAENKHRLPSHAPKYRVCQCCGKDLTRTRWQRYCGLPDCRKAWEQERLEERRNPKPEVIFTGKKRFCRYPNCKEPTGANYFYCHHHAQLLDNCYSDDAVGFGDGGPADVYQ